MKEKKKREKEGRKERGKGRQSSSYLPTSILKSFQFQKEKEKKIKDNMPSDRPTIEIKSRV